MNSLKYWRWLFALGLLTLVDDIYIAIHHFVPGPPPPYAFSFGIPTALLGIGIYLIILIMIRSYVKTGKPWLFYTLLVLLTSQCMSGVSVFYDQTFVLGFFCAYAYLYVILSIAMFLIIVHIWTTMGDQKELLFANR